MKTWRGFAVSAAVVILMNLFFINAGSLTSEEQNRKGLKPFTAEEKAKLEKIKVKKVNPNKLGLERINAERRKKGQQELPESSIPETEIEKGEPNGAITDTTSGALAAGVPQVDNSTLAAFPAVGNQANEGSCVAWAITYYQMSHEVCLTLGCDNKNAASRIYSPRWTYNMINGGYDNGSYFSDAFNLGAYHGAPQLAELPYAAGNYRHWDLNPEHWRTAINSRVSQASSIGINSDASMANAKQLLLNGHVLVIGTYINSWVFTSVQADPNAAANPFVGQSIATHLNGVAGGHAMTIVGYDDTIWADINGNGSVDAGESGAFKIANSWGTGWRDGGYAWASYDAFRATSAVAGFSPAGRVQLTQGGNAYTVTYTNYAPKLLAKVTASHATRNQMSLRFGQSSATSSTPQSYTTVSALTNDGGAFAFDGGATEIDGTFYFDLSSIATTTPSNQIFYLVSSDNSSGSPLTIKSFELVDPAATTVLNTSANVPLTVDGATKNLMIGNVQVDTQAPTVPSNLVGSVVSQKRGKRVTTSIKLTWGASTDNSGAIANYTIYRNGAVLSQTTALTYSDAAATPGVTYTYAVTAIDAQANESAKSNSVSLAK